MNQTLDAQTRYLDARVNTASQPELQLMLLDGALRFGRQAEQLWNADDERSECDRLLCRMLDVVEELVHSVTQAPTEPSKRLEEEYAFAFRQLAIAQLNHDAAPLQAALRVLDVHRETWRLACEKLKGEAAVNSAAPQLAPSLTSGPSLSLMG